MNISPALTRAYEFACHSKACAPPPAGVGGSKSGAGTAGGISRGKVMIRTSAMKSWMAGAGGTGKPGTFTKSAGRPGVGGAIRQTVKSASTTNFIDTGKARYFGTGQTNPAGHRHMKSVGETGHTASFLKRRLKGMSRDKARSKGADLNTANHYETEQAKWNKARLNLNIDGTKKYKFL